VTASPASLAVFVSAMNRVLFVQYPDGSAYLRLRVHIRSATDRLTSHLGCATGRAPVELPSALGFMMFGSPMNTVSSIGTAALARVDREVSTTTSPIPRIDATPSRAFLTDNDISLARARPRVTREGRTSRTTALMR
jgi:hypothetical protein